MEQHLWSFAEIFEGRILRVPDYQRGYAWETPQLRDLVEDLETLPPSRIHYTGTVVLHERGEFERDEEHNKLVVHDVVDGQQRLTSVTILLAVLRAELAQFEEGGAASNLCEGLRRRYLWVQKPRSTTRIPRLQLSGTLGEHFAAHVLGHGFGHEGPLTAAARRLDSAKAFFEDVCANRRAEDPEGYVDWLVDLRDRVTEQLKSTLFPVRSEADVGVIFEVMNNRGKPLSELEKVKNYLLYLAAQLSAEGLAQRINRSWADVLRQMMEGGLTRQDDEDRLLRTHWLLTEHPDEKAWDGYRSIKAHLRITAPRDESTDLALEGHVDRYLDTLEHTSLALRDIDRPERGDAFVGITEDPEARAELSAWSARLHRIGIVATFRPFLAAVRMRTEGSAPMLRAIRACELFSFLVYRVAGCRSHAGRAYFNGLAHRLYLAETDLERALADILSWTGAYCPPATYDSFWSETIDFETPRDFYAWGGLRYFLYEWERHRVGHKQVRLAWSALTRKSPKTTIEHVLPQTPTHTYWTKRFPKKRRAAYTHDLGNLSLTEDNASYGNRPFPRKRGEAGADHRCYARSLLMSEQDLASYAAWTPAAIESRRKQLIAWARDRWPHPGEASIDEDVIAAEAEATEP